MKARGGKRENAGRKPGGGAFGEPTVALRIPQSQEPVIRDFLEALKHRRQQQSDASNVMELLSFASPARKLALPLYTSKVAAGFPSPAESHVEKRLNPSDYLIENDSATFFVRVKGDSMVDAGIFEGDVLVVDRSRVAQMGDVVLALLDGEFTVKTLGKSKHGARLIPANRNYPVIEIGEDHAFEIWGVVTGSMRKFK